MDVSKDPRLSDRAVRLFGVISAHVPNQGTTAKVGQRRLASLMPKWSQAKVSRAIKELLATGHIVAAETGNGKRAVYHLPSPVFGQKQRDGDVQEVIAAPSGGRRFATVRKRQSATVSAAANWAKIQQERTGTE